MKVIADNKVDTAGPSELSDIIIMKNPILGVSGVLDVLVLLETARFTSHCLLVLYIIYAW